MQPTLRVAVVDAGGSGTRTASVLAARARARGLALSIERFPRGRDLVRPYRAHHDVLVIDLDGPGADGLDTARRVRRLDAAVQILFTAATAARAVEGYAVGAVGYLVAPVPSSAMDAALTHVVERTSTLRPRVIALRRGPDAIRIETDAITSAERAGRGVVVHTLDGDHRVPGTLTSLEALLPAGEFHRSHHGHVVNLRHVVRVDALRCDVVDGAAVPISRPRRRAFVEAVRERYRVAAAHEHSG